MRIRGNDIQYLPPPRGKLARDYWLSLYITCIDPGVEILWGETRVLSEIALEAVEEHPDKDYEWIEYYLQAMSGLDLFLNPPTS